VIRRQALRDTITIFTVSYSGDDLSRYGDAEREESEGVEVPAMVQALPGARGERELLGGQDRRDSFLRVIVAPDVSVTGLDRVEWHGRSFEVYGEPETAVTRMGPHHKTFTIHGVSGG
jgi:hypothetical protein